MFQNEKLVLIVLNGHEFTAKHRLPLIKHLKHLKYRVKCIVPEKSNADKLLKKNNIETVNWNISRSGKNIFKEIKSIYSLIKIYRIQNPFAVIHATIKPVIYGTIASKLTSCKVGNLITGLGSVFIQKNYKNRIIRFFVIKTYHFLFKYFTQTIIFQNKSDKELLIGKKKFNKAKQVVIPGSGIDCLSRGNEELGEDLNVTFIGRIIYEKGIQTIINASKKIHKLRDDIHFNLIGPIDIQNPSSINKEQVKSWEEKGLITWHGKVENIKDYYINSRIIILPSLREGLPKVLLEAGCLSRVVIATDVPGCRDVVIDNETGFLIKCNDASDLAAKILKIIDDKSLLKSMGVKSRKHIMNTFSSDIIIPQILIEIGL